MSVHNIQLTVNGDAVSKEVPAKRLLADFLRDDLHLTGTKRGCETGICGACSVLVDGDVVKSCLCLAVQMDGSAITTVEGLSQGGHGNQGELHPLQQSFMECGGLQCGYCTPGFLMTASDLLSKNPSPTESEVRHGISGNLCRCTGYQGIVESIMDASEKLRGR